MDDGFSALAAGSAYAMFRHGQDQQTAQILRAMSEHGDDEEQAPAEPARVDVHVHLTEEDPDIPAINALDYISAEMPDSWDDFVGQEPLKKQLSVYMKSADIRDDRLPHTLLASGYPGVGKTMMARLLAKMMECNIIEMVPPFNVYTLADAARTLYRADILFIDEIHKLADNGKRGSEILLKLLEDHVIFLPTGEVVQLQDITVIGATTDRDKLPETILDRFKVKPFFQPYTEPDLAEIAIKFGARYDALDLISTETFVAIAYACRKVPRVTEEMVLAARDLAFALGRQATPQELLEFIEVEPDGLTRQHIQYLTSLRQYFPRLNHGTGEIEYIVGEGTIMQALRETLGGLIRLESFLIAEGLIDRTTRGRRLTDYGVRRAEEFIANGKGA